MYCQDSDAKRYLALVTKEFLETFKENLISTFGHRDVFDFNDEECWIEYGGTVGYVNSFTKTCAQLDLESLSDYYDVLPWFESDAFDADVSDLAVKFDVIEPMSPATWGDETGVSSDDQKGNK